jgi:hypothetical protein
MLPAEPYQRLRDLSFDLSHPYKLTATTFEVRTLTIIAPEPIRATTSS